MSTAEQNRRLAWKSATTEVSANPPGKIKRIYIPDRLLGWIIPVSALLLWELLARLGMLPANWLPAPTVVGKAIYQLTVSGDLLKHAGITIARVAVGFLLGASAGTPPSCLRPFPCLSLVSVFRSSLRGWPSATTARSC